MTNLQKFAQIFKGEEGLDELIIDNFNNQDADKYELNGIEYYIFTENDIQEQLDEDFESELWDFCADAERINFQIARIVERIIDSSFNYKNVDDNYDELQKFDLYTKEGDIYIYTAK